MWPLRAKFFWALKKMCVFLSHLLTMFSPLSKPNVSFDFQNRRSTSSRANSKILKRISKWCLKILANALKWASDHCDSRRCSREHPVQGLESAYPPTLQSRKHSCELNVLRHLRRIHSDEGARQSFADELFLCCDRTTCAYRHVVHVNVVFDYFNASFTTC